MAEQTCYFGPGNSLFGVLNKPKNPRKNAPAVLLITAGLLHHVGPYRLYVHIARELAMLGFTVLRFDLGGIGDSGPGARDISISERSNYEIGHAMDYLQEAHSINYFISMGLCSGADDTLKIAVNDNRIRGCLFLDGPGYRTSAFYLRHVLLHYPRRLLSIQKWSHLVSRYFSNKLSIDSGEIDYRNFPSRAVAETQIQGLVTRGVKSCFIYTGGVSDYYNYKGQFAKMFPSLKAGNGIEWHYFPRMDHMAILQSDREKIIDKVVNWMDQSFPSNNGSPSSSKDAA